ncbi:MAG: response regulator, partial [Gammaproteobacteria bacterium]|nr:response regulator [Gammaproteobacteria bacterium]
MLGRHLRILVVDDEESLRDIVSEVLTEDGHNVTTASSGEQAINLFQKDPFPIVITDIRMAGISGLDLLAHIKKTNPSTQVVIMTSNASLDTALGALRDGAFDYLIKPFDSLEAISKVVNSAVDKLSVSAESNVIIEKLQGYNKELQQVNKELKEKSVRDGLTGLFNHKYF